MKKFLIPAILAMTSLAAVSQAQVTATYGDLILGFRASNSPGQNNNLEVDIGSASKFEGVSQAMVVAHLAAADIATAYGNTWATRSDLTWGVIGTDSRTATGPDGEPAATLWATKFETSPGTQNSVAWTTGSVSGQSVASAVIEPLYESELGSLTGKSGGSNAYSAIVNATEQGSYTFQDTYQAGESFSYFNPTVDNSVVVPSGSTYAVSDLYELEPGHATATYLGSFGLQANGTLTFAPNASYFLPGAGDESFSIQPSGTTTVTTGSSVTFNATATGATAVSYQWYVNGVALTNGGSVSGATGSRLVITGATASNDGSYTVKVTDTSGSATSTGATLTVATASLANPPGHLVNLSILSDVPTTGATMGFIQAPTGSATEPLLIRAIGPALAPAPFSVAGTLPDPSLNVVAQSATSVSVASNTGWGSNAGNISAVEAADASTGAFGLSNTASADSALVANLAAVGGGYSALVTGKSSDSGWALTEVYDATSPTSYVQGVSPRLINVSSIIKVTAGSPPTVGFAVGGTTAKTVLVRVSGPTLATFGPTYTTTCMPDPTIQIVSLNATSTILASNAGWGGDPTISAAATTVGTFPFTSTSSKDSAALLTLAPGPYSIQVGSTSNAGGYILVEVYEVP